MKCRKLIAFLVTACSTVVTSFDIAEIKDEWGASAVNANSIMVDDDYNPFRFVNVTLCVKDIYGLPIENADIKAFSEDWGMEYPRERLIFNRTDLNGEVKIRIPVGNWSFYAYGAWSYTHSHIGKGYFMALPNISISSDTTRVLQPDAYINFTLKGIDGKGFDGEIKLMDTRRVPLIHASLAGKTYGGNITVWVNGKLNYDVFIFRAPDEHPGYIIHRKNFSPCADYTINVTPQNTAHLHFNVYDTSFNFSTGTVWLEYYYFDFLNPYFPLNIQGYGDIYVEPSVFKIKYLTHINEWYFDFHGENMNLSGGDDITINFGGPLVCQGVHVHEEYGKTGIWIELTDSFNHSLFYFIDNNGEIHVPIKLWQNETLIYQDDFGKFGIDALMKGEINQIFNSEDSPEYEINLDLGPMGVFNLTGVLLSPETILEYTDIRTEHFIVHGPILYESELNQIASFCELLYDAESALTGESIKDPIYLEFRILSGFGACANYITMPLHIYLHDERNWTLKPSGLVVILGHELGHVFQGSLSNIKGHNGYYVDGWFGEAQATALGRESLGIIFGEKFGKFYHSDGSEHFFDHLRGKDTTDLAGRIEFVFYYIT